VALLVVLDSSVVIAFRDPDDALHERAVAALAAVRQEILVLPTSVYAEVLVAPMRKGREDVEAFDSLIRDSGFRVEPITMQIARRAAKLRSRTTALKLPDALVLATGDELNASAVLTGDVAWPKLHPRARAI